MYYHTLSNGQKEGNSSKQLRADNLELTSIKEEKMFLHTEKYILLESHRLVCLFCFLVLPATHHVDLNTEIPTNKVVMSE